MSEKELESLYDELNRLRIKTTSSRDFIPDCELRKLMARVDPHLDSYLDTVNFQGTTDGITKPEVLSSIRNNGYKVFAILVLMRNSPLGLLRDFITWDQMLEGRQLDSRLPFRIEQLVSIIPKQATEFHKIQWEVIAPFFRADRSYRRLEHDTILPFTFEKEIGSGGFGEVYEVRIPDSHHGLPPEFANSPEVKVARKDIKLSNERVSSFENEARIMHMLRLLRNENAVNLIASYSILDAEGQPETHCLLMPLADITLKAVLEGMETDVQGRKLNLPKGIEWFQELHGLSSALAELHHYEESHLRLKGCHLDLDPRNIFLRKGKILLADFGLSRLRNESSDSDTGAKGGASYYSAPESLTEGRQGPRSDTWSFGAIMTVIVVFMTGGSELVTEFEVARKTGPPIKGPRFHDNGRINPKVETWMKTHRLHLDLNQRRTWDICRQMLNIDPQLRPSIKDVTTRLFMLAQAATLHAILSAMEPLVTRSFKVRLEHQRLTAWGKHAGLNPGDGVTAASETQTWLTSQDQYHQKEVKSLLKELLYELTMLSTQPTLDDPVSLAFTLLQDISCRIWNTAPIDLRALMERESESILLKEILSQGSDVDVLSEEVRVQEFAPEYESRLARLSFVKAAAFSKSESGPRSLQESEVTINYPLRQVKQTLPLLRSLASIENDQNKYLCEWVTYDAQVMHVEPERLLRRVKSLVKQFWAHENTLDFGVLQCRGFFTSLSKSAFGLLFQFPVGSENIEQPWSLKNILSKVQRPSLTVIFQISLSIAQTVSDFHTLDWLHKNISPSNILFFDDRLDEQQNEVVESFTSDRNQDSTTSKNTSGGKERKGGSWFSGFGKGAKQSSNQPHVRDKDAMPSSQSLEEKNMAKRLILDRLPQPYLVGFNHSRPDDPLTFTPGPNRPSFIYQHPVYANTQLKEAFRLGYDYYSLGLVLLEIGLWEPLVKSNFLGEDIKRLPLAELREKLLNHVVPQLGIAVGEMYQEAVRVCLSDELAQVSSATAKAMFGEKVVDVLRRLCA